MGIFSKSTLAIMSMCLLGATSFAQDIQGTTTESRKAGQLVVFALDNIQSDSVAVELDEQFIVALQAQKQFSTKLCEGKYKVEASYILPHTGPNNNVIRIKSERSIHVEPEQTTYVEVVSTGHGFQLRQVTQQDWEVKTQSGRIEKANFLGTKNALITRLPQTAQCK